MLKKTPLHPLLFCLYPILYLYSVSIVEVRIIDTLLPLVINFGIMLLLFFVFLLITHNSSQAAIQTSLILIIYSNLGRIVYILKEKGYFYFDHRPVIIFHLVLIILLSWVNFRFIKNYDRITEFLNIVSVVLLTLPFFTIIKTQIQTENYIPPTPTELSQNPTELPDIYYIILDTYAGNEMLTEVYNFDNTTFLKELEEKGFYVAHNSHSNYMHTWQSLGSSLNLGYLPITDKNVDISLVSDQKSIQNPYEIVNNNFVKNQLEVLGYQIYVIPNYFLVTSWENAINVGDIPLATPFLFEYLHSSSLMLFSYSLPYEIYRDQVLNNFDLLEESISLEGPKFVFFHVSIPHSPFVFDEEGNPNYSNVPFAFSPGLYYSMSVETYHQKYIEQLQFTNSKMDTLLDKIITSNQRQAIIILQGDHGPASYTDFRTLENNYCLYERFSILNALYFPEQNYSDLYREITPVNTFRVLFQHYYNLPYDVLDDLAYFPSDKNNSEYIDVTDLVNSGYCEP